MGLTAQLEVDKYDVYTVVNLLHDTFARRILERAKMYTPVDTGAMQASWESDRENVHTSSVYLPNDNEGAKWDLPGVGKADWLLRGTGKYGPLEKPYCGKRIEPVTDFKELSVSNRWYGGQGKASGSGNCVCRVSIPAGYMVRTAHTISRKT